MWVNKRHDKNRDVSPAGLRRLKLLIPRETFVNKEGLTTASWEMIAL